MPLTMAFVLLLARSFEPGLPESWHGHWVGEFQLHSAGAIVPQKPVHAELEIKPLDREPGTTFRITYGEGESRQIRPYTLIPIPDKPERFLLDEQNGIEIEMTRVGTMLFGAFEVGDTILFSRYQLHDGEILFEILSFPKSTTRISRPQSAELEVRSPVLGTAQIGRLRRALKD